MYQEIKTLMEAGKHQLALDRAEEWVEQNPSAKSYSLLAQLSERADDLGQAFGAIGQAVEQADARSQHWFEKGCIAFKMGLVNETLVSVATALSWAEREGNSSNEEAAYFLMGQCYLILGKPKEALSRMQHVNDGFSIYLNALLTKENVIERAQRQFERM